MWGALAAFLAKNYKWIVFIVKWIPKFYNYFKKRIMSERLGLLTKEQEAFLGRFLDEKIKFNNLAMEAVDTLVFTYGIRIIDDLLVDKLPKDWHSPLEQMIDLLMEGKVDEAVVLATDIINDKIDIPVFDEEVEGVLILSIMKTIAALIVKYV